MANRQETQQRGAGSRMPRKQSPLKAGGREGIRTPGLLVANEALSQLSYSPSPTSCVTSLYISNLLVSSWDHWVHFC